MTFIFKSPADETWTSVGRAAPSFIMDTVVAGVSTADDPPRLPSTVRVGSGWRATLGGHVECFIRSSAGEIDPGSATERRALSLRTKSRLCCESPLKSSEDCSARSSFYFFVVFLQELRCRWSSSSITRGGVVDNSALSRLTDSFKKELITSKSLNPSELLLR